MRHTTSVKRFRDKKTETIWNGRLIKGLPPDVQRRVYRKLQFLMAAKSLVDLKFPPGNRLEALKGDRRGQYSIRVNDQYRLCFQWAAEGAMMIELVDYH